MKSLTSLVFHTKVVLKVVWFWRRYVISKAGFKILETSKRGSVRGYFILFVEIKVATTCLTMRILLSINQ